MKLSDHQNAFAKDLVQLLIYIDSLGLKYTLGEVFRTSYQQSRYVSLGLSKTYDSMHLKKLACDINIFVFDEVVYDRSNMYLIDISDYWKSLSPLNRWGGDFTSINDGGHFERYVR